MEILNLIFGGIFKVIVSVLQGAALEDGGIDFDAKMESIKAFFVGAEKVKNIFAWANAIVPIDLIMLLLTITGVYYLVRYAFSVIRFILGRL